MSRPIKRFHFSNMGIFKHFLVYPFISKLEHQQKQSTDLQSLKNTLPSSRRSMIQWVDERNLQSGLLTSAAAKNKSVNVQLGRDHGVDIQILHILLQHCKLMNYYGLFRRKCRFYKVASSLTSCGILCPGRIQTTDKLWQPYNLWQLWNYQPYTGLNLSMRSSSTNLLRDLPIKTLGLLNSIGSS